MASPIKIKTKLAPKALGPYSQAVAVGNTLFVSGQLPIDPETGQLVDGIEAQTAQCLSNIENIVLAAGGRLGNIVKTTLYLTNLDEFQSVNTAYARVLDEVKPARATVGVASLPLGASIEIDAIAILDQEQATHQTT